MYASSLKRLNTEVGFTLVELVLVVVLVSILGVVAVPRLMNNGFDEYGLRDQLIGRLQLVQTQAMNTITTRYRLNIEEGYYQSESCASDSSSCDSDSDWSCSSAVDGNGDCLSREELEITLTQGAVTFDAWGRPTTCPEGFDSDDGRCSITIGSRSIQIESEGYIHGE